MHAWTKFESVLEKHLHEPCEMMELAEHREKMEIVRPEVLRIDLCVRENSSGSLMNYQETLSSCPRGSKYLRGARGP